MKVIIVGLPRSGTSFLTSLIVRMGFDPGPKCSLRKADLFNPFGYYENNQLMKIDHGLLKKFNGNVMNPPELPDNWIDTCIEEKQEIKRIIKREGIEVYKGNMLIILADLYDALFPEAKWIFISRNQDRIIGSMIAANECKALDKKKLYDLVNRWQCSWFNSRVSRYCLEVRYEDFFRSPEHEVKAIAKYLNNPLTPDTLNECLALFKPNENKPDNV